MLKKKKEKSWKLRLETEWVFWCSEQNSAALTQAEGAVFMYIPLRSDNCTTVCLPITRPLHLSAAL